MSFTCVICRDLLKISEEACSSSPRHQQHPLQNGSLQNTSASTTPTHNNHNNVAGRKKEKNNSIVATKCGHMFHYPCLSVWLSQSMNLTTDSKMRCPSCKQLIYIYELVQLFPFENGVGRRCGSSNNLEQLLSSPFQQQMKGMVEQLENLIKNLDQKKIAFDNGSPSKGNDTPPSARYSRFKDSPKKMHASQLADLMREMELIRASIKELSLHIEKHAELGSVMEKQSQEISELKSKNEQLMQANERLKSNEYEEKGNPSKVAQTKTDSSSSLQRGIGMEQVEIEQTMQHVDDISDSTIKTAQGVNNLPETSSVMNIPYRHNESTERTTTTLASGSHRKSVTFLDPFDEFDDVHKVKSSIPFSTKDLRIGDKVMWIFEGNAEIGTVKWKGFIGSQINAGVEFERQLGLPIKDLSCDPVQCIFKSKPGHGRLIPVYELTPFEKTKSSKDDNRSNGQTMSSERVHSQFKHDGSTINKKIMPICAHQ